MPARSAAATSRGRSAGSWEKSQSMLATSPAPARIPRAPGIEAVADLPFWTMGEDYELLAALAPGDAAELGFPVVGRCEEGSGVQPAGLGGWDALRGE